MTGPVRMHTTPNRLAHFVNTPDGVTLAEALARAQANLDAIRPPGLERIDEILSDLGARAPAHPTSAEIEAIYRQANELAGTAGVFGLPALGQAAYSLCELLDGLRDRPWNAAAVSVHLEGFRLLRSESEGTMPAEMAAQVLSGLTKVVQRMTDAR